MGEVHPQADDILEEGGRGNFAECGAHSQFCSDKKKKQPFFKGKKEKGQKETTRGKFIKLRCFCNAFSDL